MNLLLIATSLWLVSLAWAQDMGAQHSEAVLSYIEDLADPKAATQERDPRRLVAFVELIHEPSFRDCQKGNLYTCKFEVSSPFLPENIPKDFEHTIVHEWVRLATRSALRLQLETGILIGTVACTVGAFDLGWYLLTGDLFFPADDICGDGFDAASILPACTLECDVPLDGACPAANGGCYKCVGEGYARAEARMMTRYYPEYFKNVAEAMVKTMPLGVLWGDFKNGFTYTQPVMSADLNLAGILGLAKEAQGKDARGAAYITQGGAYAKICQPSVAGLGGSGRLLLEALKSIPGEAYDPKNPGLEPLEQLKRNLADRESAGDSADRTLRAITRMDGGEFYPKYVKEKGNDLLGLGDYAESRTGTTLPSQYSCLGYATVFRVYTRTDTRTLGGALRLAACWGLPPVTVVPVPPLVFAGPRFHSDWNAVPEGYAVPDVKGKPAY